MPALTMDRDALHRPIRPWRGRYVASAVIAVEAVTFLVLVVVLGDELGWFDRVAFVLLAVALGWLLRRLGTVSAVPSEEGLHVRNVLTGRDLAWPQIVNVRFGGGNPWALLDLDDGESLAVMGIQRADGARAEAEARRLATLVDLHSRTARDD